MKFVKQSEIAEAYKNLREAGIAKEAAVKSLEKTYAKKGYEGDFVLLEDGETISLKSIEFSEDTVTEGGTKAKGLDDSQVVKSISDSITKGLKDSFKAFVPATPIDREEESRAGFKHIGEFFSSVKSVASGKVDSRMNAWREKTVAMGESTAEAGGTLVPPGFLATILQYDNLDGLDLLSKVKNIPVSGNAISIPTNEETGWGGGTQAYWQSELDTINQVRPSMKSLQLALNDLTALVPVSNNLLEDSQATAMIVSQKIAQNLRWKFNEAIINGGGSGMPLGILNSGALVTVAKENAQIAGTITQANIAKMYSRALSENNLVWLYAPQAREQILQMTQPGGMIPSAFGIMDGFGPKPVQTIYGAPAFALQNCSALGKVGDIILADLSAYVAITKQTQMATSIHMFFDTNATAFRAVARMDGKPWMQKPVTSAHDANFKLSPFITLAARA
jgi:HK97 family phage major capsid protein